MLSARQVQLARDAGALTVLPIALATRIALHLLAGELAAAASLVEELAAIIEATGSYLAPYGALLLAAWRGREAEASELIEASTSEAAARGEGLGLSDIEWASAVLYNGLGRYEDALAAAQQVLRVPARPGCSHWSLPELVEAAARSGRAEGARRRPQAARGVAHAPAAPTGRSASRPARARCSATARPPSTSTARRSSGSAAPASASSSPAPTCSTASGCAASTGASTRASSCARAHEMFSDMGAEAFAERARRELLGHRRDGAQAHRDTRDQLTAQEAQIARLAARRPLEPRDRRAAVHQPAHRRVPPAQGVHQARHQLAQRARARAFRAKPRKHSRSSETRIRRTARAATVESAGLVAFRTGLSRPGVAAVHGAGSSCLADVVAPESSSFSRAAREAARAQTRAPTRAPTDATGRPTRDPRCHRSIHSLGGHTCPHQTSSATPKGQGRSATRRACARCSTSSSPRNSSA